MNTFSKKNNTDTAVEEQWRLKRWGRFTDSQCYRLQSKGTGTLFGKGALTYIQEVACDAYTLFEDRNVQTYSMMMGKVNEPDAFAFYYRLIGFPGLEYYGGGNPLFREYGDHAGGSPDAVAWIVPNKKASFVGELKCPDRDTHWSYLQEIKDQWDLNKVSSQYYSQCQGLLRTFKCDLGHWVSFNPYFPIKDRGHIIEIKRDNRWQDDMEIRLEMAIAMKLELIEGMKNRK